MGVGRIAGGARGRTRALDVTVWRQENSATLHLVNLTNPMAMRGFVREPFLWESNELQ